jgi:hypothetical protein
MRRYSILSIITLSVCIGLTAAAAAQDLPGGEDLFLFSLEWQQTPSGETSFDFDGNDLIEPGDLLRLIEVIKKDTPLATPTEIPAEPTMTPTATPEGPPSEFAILDYFILAQDSWWHYTGWEGASTEDDFTWIVQEEMQDIGGGQTATRIRTNTDEEGDDTDEIVFFWHNGQQGQLNMAGFEVGNQIEVDPDLGIFVPPQVIVFDQLLLIGGGINEIGDEVISESPVTVNLDSIFGDPFPAAGTIKTTTVYTDFLPTVDTPLGTFTNALRMTLQIDITISFGFGDPETFTFSDNTLILKKGAGMIVQDQQPDPNDAQVQAIDSGQVAGEPIVAE